MNTLLTVHDLAAQLQVSTSTIYYWVEREEIPFLRVGRHLRFNLTEVIEYFRRRTEESAACLGRKTLLEIEEMNEEVVPRRSLKISSGSQPKLGNKE